MKISKLLTYLLVMSLPLLAGAQSVRWQRTYNQPGGWRAWGVPTQEQNGYVVMGYHMNWGHNDSSYGFMFKVNPFGNVLWSLRDTVFSTHIVTTLDSGFLTIGSAKYPTQGAFVQKLDKNGTLQWRNIIEDRRIVLVSHLQTADSNYLLYGYNDFGLLLRKLDRTGNIIWQRNWADRPLMGVPRYHLIELSTGGFLFHNNGSAMDTTACLVRTDALGNILWRRPILNQGQGIGGLAETNGVITYLEESNCVRQYDATGNMIRRNCFNFQNSGGFRMDKRRLGGFWLSYMERTNNGNLNHYLARLDAQANLLNTRLIQPADYYTVSVKEVSDSTLFYSGYIMNWNISNPPFLMVTDNAGHILPNLVRGQLSSNCSSNFKNWLVGATHSDGTTFYGKTDSLNRYEIATDTGVYTIQAHPISSNWTSSRAVSTQLSVGRIDTIPLTINCLVNCPDLKVDISTPLLRRCFSNDYSVNYCNYGTVPATGAYVEVKLDSLLRYLNASIPLTSRVGQLLRFNLGTVEPNDCRTFTIGVQVACGDSTRLGQSLCTDIRIYPDTICDNLPTWTGANIRVKGVCERDSVHFTVSNLGRVASSAVRRMTVENANIVSNALINVGANAQLHYRFPANGSTWRMSVEQEPNHPYGNLPVAVVEGCRNNPNTPISTGFVQQLPLDTRMPTARTYCMTLVGAYDPNDKMSFPAGYGANRLVEPNQDLEYMIRFQNTGTDTAFTVVIKDTLSNLLNPTSIQPLASSHAYEWTILKNNVLQFTFPKILLVDSFHNEPKSHGFIKFHIKQKPNMALGSKLYNSAAIYFDFNPPVITNRTMLTIGKQFILSSIVDPTSKLKMQIRSYPNPTMDRAVLEILDGNEDNTTRTFQLLDGTGRVLRQANFNGNRYEFEREGLNAGFYLFRVTQKGQLLGTGSIVIQ